MYKNQLPSLKIGELKINPPIIQGGMGVRVSMANLASAVANTGCAGIIAGAGIGQYQDFDGCEFAKLNEKALRYEIKKARAQSSGIIGVNIMVALSDYDNLVKAAIEEGVDLIISGAGLPLNLPAYLNGRDVKLVPVVSSARTFQIICKKWKNRFNKLPDAVIVEGPNAGGHLGYSFDDACVGSLSILDQTVKEVIAAVETFKADIPVIAAGGVFNGEDIAHFLNLGAKGVQMATRFVCTDECDAHDNFKQAYLDAAKDDLTIIKSPLGLPGRVINNSFVEKIKQGRTMPFKCRYQCLKTCQPDKVPYCIAEVLSNAAQGKLDRSFAFAGSNAYRCTEIMPVKELVETLSRELADALLIKQNV